MSSITANGFKRPVLNDIKTIFIVEIKMKNKNEGFFILIFDTNLSFLLMNSGFIS